MAIENLFNLKNIAQISSLDTAKSVELMENFQLNSKVVIKYNLHSYLVINDTRLLTESMLLQRDMQDFENYLQSKRDGSRSDDSISST